MLWSRNASCEKEWNKVHWAAVQMLAPSEQCLPVLFQLTGSQCCSYHLNRSRIMTLSLTEAIVTHSSLTYWSENLACRMWLSFIHCTSHWITCAGQGICWFIFTNQPLPTPPLSHYCNLLFCFFFGYICSSHKFLPLPKVHFPKLIYKLIGQTWNLSTPSYNLSVASWLANL